MHLSVDFERLKDHQDYLQRELRISNYLMKSLERLRAEEIANTGEISAMCLKHIQFTKELQQRIHERKALLENTTVSLQRANMLLRDKASEELHMLKNFE